jgi:hypothetical protein
VEQNSRGWQFGELLVLDKGKSSLNSQKKYQYCFNK